MPSFIMKFLLPIKVLSSLSVCVCESSSFAYFYEMDKKFLLSVFCQLKLQQNGFSFGGLWINKNLPSANDEKYIKIELTWIFHI